MNTTSKNNKLREFIQMYDAINIMQDNDLLVNLDTYGEELKIELLDKIIKYMETDLCPYLIKMNEEIGKLIANSKGHACNILKEGEDNDNT